MEDKIIIIIFAFIVFFITIIMFIKKIFNQAVLNKFEELKESKEFINEKDYGFYEKIYDFDTPEKYQSLIEKNREKQKSMIKDSEAIKCDTEWSIGGSKKKGKKNTNDMIKLTSRAFNNECESAIFNTKWNNIKQMETRIIKSFEQINKLNEGNHIYISNLFLNLKLEELKLTFEYLEKKQQFKEEQEYVKRQMREEQNAQKELEQIASEQEKYEKLLLKATEELKKSSNEKLDKLNKIIEDLNKKIEEAKRAKSMAQQTKSGHVYIISNKGSFGDNIYKIGMTRRLEPLDRVKELGDASVPFDFDVHAMIYSNDAPQLEKELHNLFDLNRVNKINRRKEFFNLDIKDVKNEIEKKFKDINFLMLAEAKEYYESIRK